MTSIRRWATVIGRSARKWYGDDAPELGAALAYYSLFAVAPLLVIAAAMAGIVGERHRLMARTGQTLCPESARRVGYGYNLDHHPGDLAARRRRWVVYPQNSIHQIAVRTP